MEIESKKEIRRILGSISCDGADTNDTDYKHARTLKNSFREYTIFYSTSNLKSGAHTPAPRSINISATIPDTTQASKPSLSPTISNLKSSSQIPHTFHLPSPVPLPSILLPPLITNVTSSSHRQVPFISRTYQYPPTSSRYMPGPIGITPPS